ncbi:hypothetical protein [Ferruginibacter sp.]
MSTNREYDIAIAWRIYPKVSKTPIVFAEDKFGMVKNSLLSFINAAKGLKIYYYFLLDGCPPEYDQLIATLFKDNYSIAKTDRIGNGATFAKQIEILLEQDKAEVICFGEDDYIYTPGDFGKAFAFIREKGVDFISGYLPMDVFTHPLHAHKRYTRYSQDRLWLTANSTCLTFMTTVTVLKETRGLFLTYARGNNDCAIWLILTKTHILNPFAYLKFSGDRINFGILKMAVKYSFKYFFTLRKYQLWMPYPAICTHLEKGNESPGTNWIAVSQNVPDAV